MNLDELEAKNGSVHIEQPAPTITYPTDNFSSAFKQEQKVTSTTNQYSTYVPENNYPSGGGFSMIEIWFQVILIALAFIVPSLFWLVKKFLKSLGLLSPIVIRILDRVQGVFHRLITKLTGGKVSSIAGKSVATLETTRIVNEEIEAGFKEDFYVAPNDEYLRPPTPDEKRDQAVDEFVKKVKDTL